MNARKNRFSKRGRVFFLSLFFVCLLFVLFFLIAIENTIKTHSINFTPGLKSKYPQSYDRNTISKNNEKQKEFEHKMASEMLQIRLSCVYMTNYNLTPHTTFTLTAHNCINEKVDPYYHKIYKVEAVGL